MFNLDGKTKKSKISVNIDLANGNTIEGCFFASQGQRLLDLMNDDRAYIPVSNDDGEIIIVQKSSIIQITPVKEIRHLKNNTANWAKA